MGVDGQFRLNSHEVSGCVLRTGVVGRQHLAHSWMPFQQFRACDFDLMDHHVSTLGVLNKVLVRRHISGDHNRVSSVINPEAKRIFKIGVLDPELGDSHSILIVYDTFIYIFGRDRHRCGEKLRMNSRRFRIP